MSTSAISNNNSTTTMRTSIGNNDIVSVQGRYLVVHNGTDGALNRFLMKGIAFPTAPSTAEDHTGYDAQGWIAVLEQLARDTDINTVRVYQMDCSKPQGYYDEFLERAADLGIYVLVPLTAPTGNGVLARDKTAPKCYNRKLYRYGKACLKQYWDHPNVLAGLIGNEVMNSLETWPAAPCLLAYARDLKRYMATTAMSDESPRTSLPLMYAAQQDSITAAISPARSMQLAMDYLSCDSTAAIDIYGINVESWCSSLQTFEFNEDGITHSGYYDLWEALQDASIPVVFSEMGCSEMLFNRDNGLEQVRDWRQVPVVLSEMADVFSGFCAYAYDGNPAFRMMNKFESWNGKDVMDPAPDYYNFAQQLHQYHLEHASDNLSVPMNSTQERPPSSCTGTVRELEENVHQLFPVERMKSYYARETSFWGRNHQALSALAALVVVAIVWSGVCRRRKSRPDAPSSSSSTTYRYQSINV